MINIKKSKLGYLEISDDKNKGAFVMEPLERGYGVTVGQAVKDYLYLCLPGAAPYKAVVKGAVSKFSKIKGVTPSMNGIITNCKQIVCELEDVNETSVKVKKKGPCTVTAGDFSNESVAVSNEELVIAEVASGTDFEMTLYFKSGNGYVKAEEHPEAVKCSTGEILMDSSFTPVHIAEYHVEDTRIGQEINFNKVTFNVQTNGVIHAEDALKQSASEIIEVLDGIISVHADNTADVNVVTQEKVVVNQNTKIAIFDLELSIRSRNCLKQTNIKTLEDLAQKSAEELLQIKNFGKKSLDELRQILSQYNMSLKGESPRSNG